MVTWVPTDAKSGEIFKIPGTTLKTAVLLTIPLTVTTKFAVPVTAVVGTVKVIWLVLQLVIVTAVPLNVSVLDP